jgi:hypothetical protein
VYYHNVVTQTSVWEKPAGFDARWVAGSAAKLSARGELVRSLGGRAGGGDDDDDDGSGGGGGSGSEWELELDAEMLASLRDLDDSESGADSMSADGVGSAGLDLTAIDDASSRRPAASARMTPRVA